MSAKRPFPDSRAIVLLFPMLVLAQPGTITTFAGAYPENLNGPALNAVVNIPGVMVEDGSGNILIAGTSRIYRLNPAGIIDTFAGNGVRGFTGDGGPAVQARTFVNFPSGMAFDSRGNLIFCDGPRIRQVSPNGIITTIAGTGTVGFSGDGGPALQAELNQPWTIAIDKQDNIYFDDNLNYRIRQISTKGIITTIAGTGVRGYTGDGGPAAQAAIGGALALAFDSQGTLFFGDRTFGVIRAIGTDGLIRTLAGANQPGSPQSFPQGTAIGWGSMYSLAFDRDDSLYLTVNNGVLKRDKSGVFSFVVGTGNKPTLPSEGPAVNTSISTPRGLVASSGGNLYLALSEDGTVARVDPGGNYKVVAGVSLAAGENGPPAFARLIQPGYLAFDPTGALSVLEGSGLGTFRRLTSTTMVLPNLSPNTGGLTFDTQGNLFFSDFISNTIQKIDTSGRQTTFAGKTGLGGYGGDGGPALQASFYLPGGMAFDRDGSLYVADTNNNRIRRVTPDGTIQTVAGNGLAGFAGDAGVAGVAQLNSPASVVVDGSGNLYIADRINNRIRKVSGGVISTFAGNGKFGFTGDGGPAVTATVGGPQQMVLDPAGNLYFSDTTLHVRKVTPGGIISTVAGNGNPGLSGDGGPATNAALSNPSGLALDASGNLYIADQSNNRVRRVQGSVPFSASPLSLLFPTALNAAAVSQTVTLNSADGASRQFEASATAPWLTVAPASGTVGSAQSVSLRVTADPTGLKKGTYFGSVNVLDRAAGAAVQIPVTLTVSGTPQQLRLSQVGLTFTALQGGVSPAAQAFQVLNSGTGTMPWTVSTSAASGSAAWITITPASGTTTAGAPAPSLSISANPAGLAAGSYYAQVNVSAASADNSPQSAVVLLNILPADGAAAAQVNPAGVLFTSVPGGTPAGQSVEIANPSSKNLSYSASVKFANGSGWLSAPAAGSLTAGQRQNVLIQPRATSLAAGVYRAAITLTFTPDNITRTIDVALVVNAAAGASGQAKGVNGADNTCAPKSLVAVIRRPGASYQTAAGWPVPVEAAVVDDCGAALTNGSVLATFSTNDPVLALYPSGQGTWQATWASRNAAAATTVTITIQANSTDQKLTGQTQVAIKSDLNPDQPSIVPGGILDAASFQRNAPVSPGEYISIFGARLAKDLKQAQSVPLPLILGDTVVAVGGKIAPLNFVSDGQVNAVLPYGIPDSTTLQMIIRRGSTLSLPEQVLIASVHPAVFTVDGTGSGQGYIYGATSEGTVFADNAHPVKAGTILEILATGLGPVNPPVEDGKAPGSDPFSLPVNPVEVFVQGMRAQVLFAGLLPGYPAIFQINAVVPAGVTSDPGATLVVTAGGQPSPAVTLATVE